MTELTANAYPAKSFFVKVITRDISLDDCILDLLDNCIDGVERTMKNGGTKEYKDFYAEIMLSPDKFTIIDNCGGIPKDIAMDYAFMFGRPDDRAPENIKSIGVYGIGMKRAFFKIGSDITVISHNKSDAYKVVIGDDWLNDPKWHNLPITELDQTDHAEGTTIEIQKLNEGIADRFQEGSEFIDDLRLAINRQYARILQKGFKIKVNSVSASPVDIAFKWQPEDRLPNGKERFAPIFWKHTINNVSVMLVAGYYGDFPSEEEVEEGTETKTRSDRAGWTIICNDRIVLYCDKTSITGWGVELPHFHTQYIGFSGVAVFESEDIKALPLTTTKHGVDAGSPVFIRARMKLIDITRKFIDFTNKWKGKNEEAKQILNKSVSKSLTETIQIATRIAKKDERRGEGAWFHPTLPAPAKDPTSDITIRFTKTKGDIELVKKFLFPDPARIKPGVVGSECFDRIKDQAERKNGSD